MIDSERSALPERPTPPTVLPTVEEILAWEKQAILNAVGDKLPGPPREPQELVFGSRRVALRGISSSGRIRRSRRRSLPDLY